MAGELTPNPAPQGWGANRRDLALSPRATPRSRRLRPPGSIPAETMLVGREELLAQLLNQVLQHRMVTLTGVSGIGKTELALWLARRLHEHRIEALGDIVVRWVSLEKLTNNNDHQRRDHQVPANGTTTDGSTEAHGPAGGDPDGAEIDRAVVAALGYREFGHRSLDEVDDAIRRHFASIAKNNARTKDPKATVLILDNCESDVDDARDFCQMLLDITADFPRTLRIVCTSREELACSPEYVVHVNPLEYPEDDHDLPQRRVWPAIAAFRRYAESFGNQLPNDPNLDRTIARIVRDAAGIPLAIRIAAGGTNQASPEEILALAEEQPDEARSPGRGRQAGRGGAHRRIGQHEGLRRAFATSTRAKDWTPELDRVLRRLAVFPASFTQDAAATICADFDENIDTSHSGSRILPDDVGELLAVLTQKSFVEVDNSTLSPRWYLLGPVRQYALDQLRTHSPDEETRLRERHVRYFYHQADVLTEAWLTPNELDVVREAQLEMHNFHAASAEACSRRELIPMGMGIVHCLAQARLFHRAGNLFRGRQEHLRAAEAGSVIAGIGTIGEGFTTSALFYSVCQGEFEEARRALRQILDVYPDGDESSYPGNVCMVLAVYLIWVDKDRHAIDLAKVARQKILFECNAWLDGTTDNLFPAEIRDLVDMMTRQGLNYGLFITKFFGALAAALYGTEDEARAMTQDYVDGAEACGAPTMITWSLMIRAIALMRHSTADDGQLERALELAEDALVDMIEMDEAWGTNWGTHLVIGLLGELLRRQIQRKGGVPDDEDQRDAVRLAARSGAARKMREAGNIRLPGLAGLEAWYEKAVQLSRDVAGASSWETAEGTAHALNDQEVIGFDTRVGTVDVDSLLGHIVPEALREAWNLLPPQQKVVVYHVATGHKGSAIAAMLHITEKTVDTHAKRAKRALNIEGSRTQLKDMRPVFTQLWHDNPPDESELHRSSIEADDSSLQR